VKKLLNYYDYFFLALQKSEICKIFTFPIQIKCGEFFCEVISWVTHVVQKISNYWKIWPCKIK